MRPWNSIEIIECNESLISIPQEINIIHPHPYLSVGAPYTERSDPWQLRVGVIQRLLTSKEILFSIDPNLNLAVYDAWRPIKIQSFMVEHVIKEECFKQNVDYVNKQPKIKFNQILNKVGKFWAKPTLDSNMPPPHCTGSAIDLTLSTKEGELLDMGGDIDSIELVSHPDFYENYNSIDEYNFNQRRKILSKVMLAAGFVQHPNEWWHFSYGDQMWAYFNEIENAIYGECSPVNNFKVA